jgi:hypothetical protein
MIYRRLTFAEKCAPRDMRICPILLLLTVLHAVAAKVPDSSWQTGILTDLVDETHTVNTEYEHAYGTHRHSTSTESSYTIPHYIIETDKYIYEAIANGGYRRRVLNLTVNSPLKYAIVGTAFYIQDEDGKERKMTILKKTLKARADPAEQK